MKNQGLKSLEKVMRDKTNVLENSLYGLMLGAEKQRKQYINRYKIHTKH